jgi:2,3-bisphosphoglycerate-independent phosphoglycerate mutase
LNSQQSTRYLEMVKRLGATPMTKLDKRPVVLIVRDGWGHNPYPQWDKANATIVGDAPVDRRLHVEYPWAQIHCAGEDVGLPHGVMGNSEVGHQNMGAGRIVDQEIMRITRLIRDGSFFKNEVLLGAFEHAKKNGGSVHLMGLFSDGRVHSDMDHAYAVVRMAVQVGFPSDKFFVHFIGDGRDTPPDSGKEFMRQVLDELAAQKMGRVASVVGRFYAMDRDNRWDRVERAYRLLTQGAERVFADPMAAILDYYAHPTGSNQTGDEFIVPTSISKDGKVEDAQKIKAGDAVIFFNYRGDRPREISKAFALDDAAWAKVPNGGFARGAKIENLYFAGMTAYEKGLPIKVVFEKPPKMKNILGEYLSGLGLRQFRAAETEKFPHVTFFFNDYREEPFPGEDRQIVPSPREVTTYDQKPEMSAIPVCDEVVRRIESGQYDVVVVNFANGDMVGHTGVLAAAAKAVETVDQCVGRIVAATQAKGGALLITADHGNCEQMIDPESGNPHTAHTTYDVDLIVVDERLRGVKLREGGRLADIAPTLLDLMGLPKPAEMTGVSLVPAGTLRKD